MKKTPTVTISIPTCYGGKWLASTIRSIRASQVVSSFPIVVRADSKPIPPEIKCTLRSMDVTLVENKIPGSQMHKIKQMLDDCSTDLFISMQDDIRLSPDVIARIVETFSNDPTLTMVCVAVLPEVQKTMTGRVVRTGPLLAQAIGKRMNNGDNYLVANGRCLAFRTEFLKQFRFPESIVNSDAYLYLENKRLGGTFRFLPEARVYIQSPKTLRKHLNQSSRFQYSQEELQPLFDTSISGEYRSDRKAVLNGISDVFFKDPIAYMLYSFVLLYTRWKRKGTKTYNSVYWGVDYSTKRS